MPQGKPNLLHASYFVVILDVGHWVKKKTTGKKREVVAILFSRYSRAFITDASGWFQFLY